MHIQYLSLPNTIPSDVMESIDAVKAKPFATGTVFDTVKRPVQDDIGPRLRVKDVSYDLTEYLQTLFPFPIFCRYFFLKHGFPITKNDSSVYAINYVLQTGGSNVNTNFYDKPTSIIESVCIEPFKWHSINVSKLHLVDNIDKDSERITLVVNSQGDPLELESFITNNTL